ncbi:thiamine pyrophosphate-binding protein [Aquicella lusitana]|uniref:Acetolactate synthase large subunit n=1 Tax=Aquicella lusitana TaxID=254246 RepID=A0A370FYF4_9COXI|nr:thiamine pyrophosphate-binding protein [Aquicella lusitana]RDI36485.1 acetolactate synthase large subunit [Aquicella lusitana]VVC74584.1 Glyoxylate carboligase [Aquicella lusitana]
MKATEYLIKMFEQEGIRHLFMVPGFHVDPIMSALQIFPDFTGIVAAHEGGAAMMADGYAKVSGKFGIVAGIGGPGITNMMTAITTAFSDKTPIFIITGDAESNLQGRGSFQDTTPSNFDANTFLMPVTNKRLVVTHAETLKPHIDSLLRNMLGVNRGPVQLTIPSDFENCEINSTIKKLSPSLYHPRSLDREACDKIWSYLKNAQRIVVLAGMGCLHSESTEELVHFSENFEIPIATTLAGKSVFPENHRLSLGVLNWFGNPRAIETILGDEIEVLIVLGSRLNQVTTAKWSKKFLPSKALIINDINENSYFGNFPPDLFILGDTKTFLAELNRSSDNKILRHSISERKKWIETINKKIPQFYDEENLSSNKIPIHPARVIKELRAVMPKNTILFSGEGASGFIASHYWICYEPRQHFTQVKSMSPMGWSIAASIGGKAANPNVPVVSIICKSSDLI